MSSAKQRAAARRNIKKASATAKARKTISHLSRKTRTTLGKHWRGSPRSLAAGG
jgi:hypothetical protein